MALKAVVTGKVMDVYEKKYKAKDGSDRSCIMADIYVNRQVYPVSKVPMTMFKPDQIVTVPVLIYTNQYGLSLVFDADAAF